MVFASRVVDRKTPVAASTITKEEITQKLGNQEFVKIFKSTPGIYATEDSGGFGDGEILSRGFRSENVAVLINGIPVNATTDGRVFWSNWGGIGNVTSSSQIQRGLGAAKIAVPSIGGTINIITEGSEAEKGGQFTYGLGNNGFTKYGLKLSTGLINGWAATVYADRTFGDGYVDGTPFNAVTYFGSITKKINNNHKLVLTGTGAPQRHGTRFERLTITDNKLNERGIRLNRDWGTRNGEVFSLSENFFHKPLISLNHYWTLNDYNKISTSVYYSSGTGGISFDSLAADADRETDGVDNFRLGNQGNGPVDVDAVVKANQEKGSSNIFLETRNNNHVWWGGLSTINSSLNDYLDLTGGLDIRYAEVDRSRVVEDLLGGEFVSIRGDGNAFGLGNTRKTGEVFGFDNKTFIRNLGAFAQLEYDHEWFTAFVAGNVAHTSYKRQDFYEKLPNDPNQKTKWVNFIAPGFKGGANFRLDNYHNIFFNAGYFERAPFTNGVFLNNSNDDINEDAENQKIISVELGYGLRSEKLALNLNLYRTEWNDRSETQSFVDPNDQTRSLFANILGVNALHQGVEMDFEYRPFNFLTVTGMLSVGDWTIQDDVFATLIDENNNVVLQRDFYIADLPVGRAAQTTSALGVKLKVTKDTSLFIDYNFYDRYFADYSLNDDRRIITETEIERFRDQDLNDPNQNFDQLLGDAIDTARTEPYQLPDYGIFDVSMSHKFKVASLEARVIARMNNVFNQTFISRAEDIDGSVQNLQLFFGTGRTFSLSTIVNF